MSNAVYPTLRGLGFGTVRSVVPPKVHKFTTPADREYRARNATLPRYRYNLQYEFLRSSAARLELQTLVGFYNARGAEFDSFLFTDVDDCTASGDLFGTGDGTTTTFALLRSMGGFAEPVSAVVGQPAVSIDGVRNVNVLAPTSNFETDTNADGMADGWAWYWGGTTGALTASLSSTVIAYGAKSQQVSAAAIASGSAHRIGVQSVAAVACSWLAGAAAVFSAYVRGVSGATGTVYVNWYDAGGTNIDSWQQDTTLTGSDTRLSVTGTVLSTAVSCRVYVWMSSVPGGGAVSLLVDAAQLEPGSTPGTYRNNIALATAGQGTVTFATAPANGAQLTWSGSFYRRVRFDMGQLDATKFLAQLWNAQRVELLSLRPGDTQ